MKFLRSTLYVRAGSCLAVGLLQSAVPHTIWAAEAGVPSAVAIPKELSLADAQKIAFERNWDLLASAAGIDAATAQKIIVREFPNPSLSMSSAKINVDNHPNSTPEGNTLWDRSYDTIFAVNQLFEIGGKRRNRRLSADAGFEAAKAQFLDVKRTLDLGVAKAYVSALQAEENARILGASAATLRQEAKIAEVREKAGDISTSDRSQIEVAAGRFEFDARAAETAAAQARVALDVLIGVAHPAGERTLTDKLEELAAAPAPSVASTDGTWRPDVVAADAALRRAEADLRLQRANRIPDPTVLLQYEHEPPDSPNSVGLGVSFPLPLWNRNRGGILAAEAVRQQAQLALEKVKAQAVAEMAISRLAYDDALQRWMGYRDRLRPQSEQVRKTLSYSYQKGGASLLDMLVAERNDNEVRLAAMQAAGDAAAALAALKAATQQIQPSQLKP